MCMSNDVFYNGGLSDPFSFPFERGASFLLFFVGQVPASPFMEQVQSRDACFA